MHLELSRESGQPVNQPKGQPLRARAELPLPSMALTVPTDTRAGDQTIAPYSPCGGRTETTSWSPAILPTLAAPPGEPTVLKNSTLAL